MIELTFLGTGNAFAPGGRYWSGFLVNGRYLFDVPPTALAHLKRLGKPLEDIWVIFLSHFHGDHFAGLPFLFLEYAYLTRRSHDLYIVGPPGVQRTVEKFSELCYPGLSSLEAGYRRVYTEADPRGPQTVDEIVFQAVAMPHSPGKLQCFGYRLSLGGKTIAYTGDTEYGEAVFHLAEGADVMIVDCTYSTRGPDHMGFENILEVRKGLPLTTTLILTHREADPEVSGLNNVIVAQDFATYHFA